MTMEPMEFIRLTGASYKELADLCNRPYATVAKWFCRGKAHRRPTPQDCRILELAYKLKAYGNNGQIWSFTPGLVSPQAAVVGKAQGDEPSNAGIEHSASSN